MDPVGHAEEPVRPDAAGGRGAADAGKPRAPYPADRPPWPPLRLWLLALAAACAALTFFEAEAAALCLPLLVGAWALARGKTWAAFGLLGLGAMTLLFCGFAASHEPAPLAAGLGVCGGLGLACFGLTAPLLWRRDALATAVAAIFVLALGFGFVAWYTCPPDAVSLPLDVF